MSPEKIYIRNYITQGCTKNIVANTSAKREHDIEYIRSDIAESRNKELEEENHKLRNLLELVVMEKRQFNGPSLVTIGEISEALKQIEK